MREYSLAALGTLLDLENSGFDLTVAHGTLWVTPADHLTPAQEDEIRQHRDELVELVKLADDAPSPRALAARGQQARKQRRSVALRHTNTVATSAAGRVAYE